MAALSLTWFRCARESQTFIAISDDSNNLVPFWARGGGIRGPQVRDIIAPDAMALTPGTKLGPYEIQSPLGAGGVVSRPFYGVSPDGKKLLLARVAQQVSQSVTVVTNFAGVEEIGEATFRTYI